MKVLVLCVFLFLLSCGELGTFSNNADDCDGYSDPANSNYILPFRVGESYEIMQGNCGQVTHLGAIRFAYDFDTQDGDVIIAARAGTVIKIEDGNDGGALTTSNYVRIEHVDGSIADYVHLLKDTILVNVGEVVNQGQEIAQSGTSGTLRPHLHFHVFASDSLATTVPVTFRNAGSNPNGLREGNTYSAEAFTPDSN